MTTSKIIVCVLTRGFHHGGRALCWEGREVARKFRPFFTEAGIQILKTRRLKRNFGKMAQ